jgi:hypothetical protein
MLSTFKSQIEEPIISLTVVLMREMKDGLYVL